MYLYIPVAPITMAPGPLILPGFVVNDLRRKGLGPFSLPQFGHTVLPQGQL